MNEQDDILGQFLSPEVTARLLMYREYLYLNLQRVGEKHWINDYVFWIRLKGKKPFQDKFYLIDTRFRQPRTWGATPIDRRSPFPMPLKVWDEYLVFFDGWEFPEVGKVYIEPGTCCNNGKLGYTIILPHDPEDLNIFMPATDEDKKTRTPEWCLGEVIEVMSSV